MKEAWNDAMQQSSIFFYCRTTNTERDGELIGHDAAL